VVKRTTSAPHTVTAAAPRTTTVRHAAVAKPRTVTHARPAAAAHAVSALPAPAAPHTAPAPSPVALSTPVHGSGDNRGVALIAALGIALVALVRVKVARALRSR